MFFLNVDIKSLLGYTKEVENSVLIRASSRLETIRYVCNTCTDHLDLQVCTILLSDTVN